MTHSFQSLIKAPSLSRDVRRLIKKVITSIGRRRSYKSCVSGSAETVSHLNKPLRILIEISMDLLGKKT